MTSVYIAPVAPDAVARIRYHFDRAVIRDDEFRSDAMHIG
jgi:hypothetical protein